jgi:hypothetical protein
MNETGRRTIAPTELPAGQTGDLLSQEWETYRHEVTRLLAEGQEEKFVLIKGQQIIAVYDTWEAAREAGLRLYLLEPFLVRQVLADEPVLRVRGYSLPCPE